MYQFEAPIGTFVIQPAPGGVAGRWELVVNGPGGACEYVAAYGKVLEAVAAVHDHRTGWPAWDGRPPSATDPANLAGWARTAL